MVIIVMIVN